jgi:hypothetical protein
MGAMHPSETPPVERCAVDLGRELCRGRERLLQGLDFDVALAIFLMIARSLPEMRTSPVSRKGAGGDTCLAPFCVPHPS